MSFKIKDPNRDIAAEVPQFMTRMERLWFFAETHRRAVIGGLLLLCLAPLAIGIIVWLEQEKEKMALELHAQAVQLYRDRPFDDPEKANDNLKRAISIYRQILEEFPRTSSAELALYFIGNALVDQKNYTGAIEAYQNYVVRFDHNGILLGLVYQRLGSTHLLNGDHENAVKAFSQVLATPDALNKDQVLFELAKLEEEESQPEKALAYYQELFERHPTSPFANEAAVRIKAFEQSEKGDQGGADAGGKAMLGQERQKGEGSTEEKEP